MLGDVEVDDPSSLVGQYHEDKEYFVGNRRHDKEIQGHEVLHVVFHKGLPRGKRWARRSDAIRLHRQFRHVNAQLAQLADDAWGTSGGIGLLHGADELTKLFGNPWP